MVKQILIAADFNVRAYKSKKQYFECEECKFMYGEKAWAEKCENWCKEHNIVKGTNN